MVNGMADRDTIEPGGEGIAFCPEGLIYWCSLQCRGECGVMVKGGCHFFFRAGLRGGEIRYRMS
jgi:hypothetical protein